MPPPCQRRLEEAPEQWVRLGRLGAELRVTLDGEDGVGVIYRADAAHVLVDPLSVISLGRGDDD